MLCAAPGLMIRREWGPNGWRLVFAGRVAKGVMVESVMGGEGM